MSIKEMRLAKGWSQEQLSEFSGLNVRTIQRIEKGQKASTESLKALAAVFETDLILLTQKESSAADPIHSSEDLASAKQHVENLKAFYWHLIVYVVVNVFLVILNYSLTPENWWFYYASLSWIIGLVLHAAITFDLFGALNDDWQKRQIDQRLNKK